ncbi:MAG: hypothetical protein AAF802_24535, partial [Planctomycetota bacterium]
MLGSRDENNAFLGSAVPGKNRPLRWDPASAQWKSSGKGWWVQKHGGLVVQDIDQKAAIMIVIEHFGDIEPGTRCSAVLFDAEKIHREQEFHAKLYSKNGVDDPDVRR